MNYPQDSITHLEYEFNHTSTIVVWGLSSVICSLVCGYAYVHNNLINYRTNLHWKLIQTPSTITVNIAHRKFILGFRVVMFYPNAVYNAPAVLTIDTSLFMLYPLVVFIYVHTQRTKEICCVGYERWTMMV